MTARNEHLRAVRETARSPRTPGAGMSRDELAEAVNAWLAEHTGHAGALDGQAIARYERGRVRLPGRDYRAGLRAVLDATDAELGFDPTRPSSPLSAPQTADLDAAGVMGPEANQRVHGIEQCPRRVDTAGLDALAQVLAGVRRLEDETSAADVLPTVRGQADLAARLAQDARGELRPQATGLHSELAQYLGWLHIPGCQWHEARQHLDRAAVLALEADDPQRLSTALSFQAYRAMLLGDLSEAAALTDAAGRDSRVDPGLATYNTLQRAEIAAYGQDRHQAVRLLITADRMIEQLPATEELPDSSYWYTPSVLTGHKGIVLSALGEHDAAHRAAAESLAAMPTEWATAEWAAQHRAVAEG